MDDALLDTLLTLSDEEALRAFIETRGLDIETVKSLKDHSACFYFDHPAKAERVARAAY